MRPIFYNAVSGITYSVPQNSYSAIHEKMVLSQLCWVGFHGMTQFYSNTQSMWLLGIFMTRLDQTKQNCRSGFCPGRIFSLFKTLLFEGCKISNFLSFGSLFRFAVFFLGLEKQLSGFFWLNWIISQISLKYFKFEITNDNYQFLPHSFSW